MTGAEPFLFGAAATGAGATATAATTGLLGAAGSFALAQAVPTFLIGASAFSSVMGGSQEAAMMKFQAAQSSVNASNERLTGRIKANQIRDQLDEDMASQNAIFAARGQLAGEGSAQAAQDTANQNATRDIKAAQFNAGNAALADEGQATQYRAGGKIKRAEGYQKAAFTVAGSKTFQNFGDSLLSGL